MLLMKIYLIYKNSFPVLGYILGGEGGGVHPDYFVKVMSKILYAHIWAYAPNMIDFGP